MMLMGLLPTTALAAGSEISEAELTVTPPAIGQVLDFAPGVPYTVRIYIKLDAGYFFKVPSTGPFLTYPR